MIAAPRDLDVELALDLGQMPVVRAHNARQGRVVVELELCGLRIVARLLVPVFQSATAATLASGARPETISALTLRGFASFTRTRAKSPIA